VLHPDRYVVQAPWSDRGPDVVVARQPVPVTATLRWQDGATTTGHPATAKAWTPSAVEVVVRAKGGSYYVWLPVADVARRS
jgi:hypothetical protein